MLFSLVASYSLNNSLAMFTDLYEITMAQTYFKLDINYPATFELFIRTMPRNRGYLVSAGLEL